MSAPLGAGEVHTFGTNVSARMDPHPAPIDMMKAMTRYRRPRTASRRRFLGLAGSAAGAAFLAACGAGPEDHATATPSPPPATPEAIEPTATPTPAPPPAATLEVRRVLPPGDRGQVERLALPETAWQTPVYINRSGQVGPSVMVLGGVHGNEPGSWAAADEIADWTPDRGLLVVVPRANVVAIEAGERTLKELGDLNRFYPGVPPEAEDVFPMQRMAHAIVELAREFQVSLLLDLHESWGFFNERPEDGTAFLGQTVTNGADVSESPRIEAVANEVNALIAEREQLVFRDRDRNRFANVTQRPAFDPSWPRGGTSSLGIGGFVDDLVPVLIEMGQQNQTVDRRSELHQLFVRTALGHEGLLDPA